MKKKYQTVSVGSATLDVFLQTDDLSVVKSEKSFTGRFLQLPYGVKAEVSDLTIQSGGGGTNTAAGFARLGLRAAVLARFGDDYAGSIVRQELVREKISLELTQQVKGDQTDYSTILIGPDGGRTILVSRGLTKLDLSQVPWGKIETDWFYVSSIEGNLDLLERVLSEAARQGAQVAVNPGRKELAQLKSLIKLLNRAQVVIVNQEEAARLTNLEIGDRRLLPALAKLVEGLAVVTAADKGVTLYDRQDRKMVADSFSVKVKDATGAGDGFGCGFIGGLARGYSLEEALRLGAANGASVVTKIGAKTGLVRAGEVDLWFRRQLKVEWEKSGR